MDVAITSDRASATASAWRARRTLVALSAILGSVASTPVFGTQPCPPGTSPWTFANTSLLALFIATMLIACVVLIRKTVATARARKTLLYGFLALLTLFTMASGALAIVIRVSWTGTCR